MTPTHQRMQALSGQHHLEGRYQPGTGARRDLIDPATEQPTGFYCEATPDEIDRAVAAAGAAQRGWWALSALDRANALHQVADRLLVCTAEVGECLTREMGKPFRESNWEIGASASAFRYFAELARHDQGRVAGPAIAGQLHMTLHEPLGTVVSIVPFNYPALLFGWQAAAALAAGNAIIVKPSELTPLTLLMLAPVFDHLPPGLVQVLTGGSATGQRLVEHPRTHAVAFTGSVPAAQAVDCDSCRIHAHSKFRGDFRVIALFVQQELFKMFKSFRFALGRKARFQPLQNAAQHGHHAVALV